MKSFKNLEVFKKKLVNSLCWDDYIKVNGRVYKMYEYGENGLCDYVYFLNKRSSDMICIQYDCPASNYVNGKKVITQIYKFHSLDLNPKAILWR